MLVIGSPDRFACGKQIGSYPVSFRLKTPAPTVSDWGTSPSKAVRWYVTCWPSQAQAAVRWDSDWRRRYAHLSMRPDRCIAQVAMARRLAISLYWMWRKGYDYQQSLQFGSHAGEPGYRHGVK